MDVYVIRVNMTPMEHGVVAVNVEGSDSTRYYSTEEADDMAMCAALQITAERIARREIEAEDGFTVKVEFVYAEEKP